MRSYAQIKAIEEKNKMRWLAVNNRILDTSGIYILTREESGFKYAYIGQAKHILTRLAQHLTGYQHIDLSLKKHGLFSPQNPCGWNVDFALVDIEKLDAAERKLIQNYGEKGYQLRNKTGGGQDAGKFGIADNRPARGYHDGVKQGYENARKEIRHLFDLHLTVSTKSSTPNKNQEKALDKFRNFIEEERV